MRAFKPKFQPGDKAVWKPDYWKDGKWVRDDEGNTHPWRNKVVTVIEVPSFDSNVPLYKVSVDNAPNVNNPHAYEYWADAHELEKTDEQRT